MGPPDEASPPTRSQWLMWRKIQLLSWRPPLSNGRVSEEDKRMEKSVPERRKSRRKSLEVFWKKEDSREASLVSFSGSLSGSLSWNGTEINAAMGTDSDENGNGNRTETVCKDSVEIPVAGKKKSGGGKNWFPKPRIRRASLDGQVAVVEPPITRYVAAPVPPESRIESGNFAEVSGNLATGSSLEVSGELPPTTLATTLGTTSQSRSKNRRKSVDNSLLVGEIPSALKKLTAGAGGWDKSSPTAGGKSILGETSGGTPSLTAGGLRGIRWGNGIRRTGSVESFPSFGGGEGEGQGQGEGEGGKGVGGGEGSGGKVGVGGAGAGAGGGGKEIRPLRKLLRRWSLSSLRVPAGSTGLYVPSVLSSSGHVAVLETEGMVEIGQGGEEKDKPEKPKILFHMVNVLRRPMKGMEGEFEGVEGEELGRGRYGVIYKCVEKSTGKFFACKTILKEQLKKWQQVEDVRTEVEVLEALRGRPHIVELREAYETQEAIHIVTELLDGGELFDRIKKFGKYSEKNASVICRKLAESLEIFRNEGIVHRDLKPENIILKSKNDPVSVKIIDFGLAAYFVEADTGNTEIVGTPNYCAPESLENGVYSAESDIWSLGIILYILLSGIPPFCAKTTSIPEILKIINSNLLDLDEGLWLVVSSESRDLIRRMLERDPKKRIKPREILSHPWIRRYCENSISGQKLQKKIEENVFSGQEKFEISGKNQEIKSVSQKEIMASLLK